MPPECQKKDLIYIFIYYPPPILLTWNESEAYTSILTPSSSRSLLLGPILSHIIITLKGQCRYFDRMVQR